jgi:hypothetical protein
MSSEKDDPLSSREVHRKLAEVFDRSIESLGDRKTVRKISADTEKEAAPIICEHIQFFYPTIANPLIRKRLVARGRPSATASDQSPLPGFESLSLPMHLAVPPASASEQAASDDPDIPWVRTRRGKVCEFERNVAMRDKQLSEDMYERDKIYRALAIAKSRGAGPEDVVFDFLLARPEPHPV